MQLLEGDSAVDVGANLGVAAIGALDPDDQIVAGILLGSLVYIMSGVGFVFMAAFLPAAFILIVLGALRLSPRIDSLYPLSEA